MPCPKIVLKISHNMVFLLLFLHRFKIRSISFTLTCITGKYFIKPWPDIQYIFISILYMIFVFCLRKQTSKQTTKENLFFYLNRTWVLLTQARGTLSNISLFFKRKRVRGWGCYYACFVQLQKHLPTENSGTTS